MKKNKTNKVNLPMGISDFRRLVEYKNPGENNTGFLFVDKTLFIREIIEDSSEIKVITRPRRFGKTLNLSMLQYFFAEEVNGVSTKGLFDNLEIAKHPNSMVLQGGTPVIFLTFKDLKHNNFDDAISGISGIIRRICAENRELLLNSDRLDVDEKDIIQNYLKQEATKTLLETSLLILSEFIYKATNKKPVILIDEYDEPIQQSYLHNYYDLFIDFMRNFLGSALKGNNFLTQAVLTGITRVSKESLFSGLNNVKIYSVTHEKYSNFFGFTESEVDYLFKEANLDNLENLEKEKTKETNKVKEWYNGYKIGKDIIYNPFSIISCIQENGALRPYWINTSGNDLIREILITSEISTQDKIGDLIAGKIVKEIIDEHLVFSNLKKNRAAIWSLFLMAGYLKALSCEFTEYGDLCELAIPNKEVEFLFKQIYREWISGSRGIIWYQELLASLVDGKTEEFGSKLQEAIIEMASYHDTSNITQEAFYQGLMLGILSGLKDTYEIKSNRESGIGRYDLIIIPKDPSKLGIVMEFKAVGKEINDEKKLINEAKKACSQIKKSKYISELKSRGISNICQMGIAFSGKILKVVTDIKRFV